MSTFEEVLVIPAQVFQQSKYYPKKGNFYSFESNRDFLAFQKLVSQNYSFRARKTNDESDVEFDKNFQQLGTYILIINQNHQIFFYTRKTDAKVVEKRLSGMVSCGVGGHINKTDINIKNPNMLLSAAQRELFEEIIFKNNNTRITKIEDIKKFNKLKPVGLIKNNQGVGIYHLGLLFKFEVNTNNLSLDLDPKENQSFQWLTIREYQDKFANKQIEPETWTQIAMKQLFS